MREHPIVSEHPRIVEHRRKVAEIEEAQAALNARLRERREEYEQARAAWSQARHRALLEGTEIPPEPEEPPSARDAITDLMAKHREATQAETVLLADIGDEIYSAASAREPELLNRAEGLIAELAEVATELDLLAATLARVDRSRATTVPNAPGSVDVRGLVASILRGETVLRPERRARVLAGRR